MPPPAVARLVFRCLRYTTEHTYLERTCQLIGNTEHEMATDPARGQICGASGEHQARRGCRTGNGAKLGQELGRFFGPSP